MTTTRTTSDDLEFGRRGRGRRSSDDGSDEVSCAPDPRVSVLELQSSVAFGVGSLLLLVVSDSSSFFVRALASFLLALHVVPEMCLDGPAGPDGRRRTHPHGRYVATVEGDDEYNEYEYDDDGSCLHLCCGGSQERRRRWNQAQSIAFMVASLVQAAGYGFLLQIQRQPWVLDAYLPLNLAAASLWMLSGIMVVGALAGTSARTRSGRDHNDGDGCPRCCCTVDAGLLLVGKALYVLGCVCWLTAAVNQYRNHAVEPYLGGVLQRLAAGLWFGAAVLFVVGDGRRLCGSGGQMRRKRASSPRTSSSPSRRRRGDRALEQGRDNVQETSSSSGDGEEDDVDET